MRPLQQHGLPLPDVQHSEGYFGLEKVMHPEQGPDGKEQRPGKQKAFGRGRETVPVHAHGQRHGEGSEAEDSDPVRARGYEQTQSRVFLQPPKAGQKGFARDVRQMEQEGRRLLKPGCRGDQAEKRQRQHDEAQRRKPDEIDREPEGRTPEGIQHKGKGGELRGDGAAEGQPEDADEPAPGGAQGRDLTLQRLERRER